MNATKKAWLIMAANSIGNSEDIPVRALNAVKEADVVIFEEDKIARQVLKRAKIHREYLKFSEHKQQETLELAYTALKEAKTVLYMSDQGTPNLADPGRELLHIAYKLGARVFVIPGPSSITAAISACPFDTSQFFYRGFLPQDREQRVQQLRSLAKSSVPVVILDTPYRLKALLEDCTSVFDKNKRAFLALDISNEGEMYVHGNLGHLLKSANDLDKKLNFVLILDA